MSPLSDLDLEDVAEVVRESGASLEADEIIGSRSFGKGSTFSPGSDVLGHLFNRFIKTTHVCGFLSDNGYGPLVSVNQVTPDLSLEGEPLKVTLEGLHIARYPGFGTHRLLFDFALQPQEVRGKRHIYHYNARFEAGNGETVPVRNFPLFFGLRPSTEGIIFGFQTVNVASSFDEGLLDFLKRDDFKQGLLLTSVANPVLGQLSEMATSLTSWLASQSTNIKVQEFRQGLDFGSGRLGGGLASGSYVVVQIPSAFQDEWNWTDWEIDPQLLRLVHKGLPSRTLDFNHIIIGIRRLNIVLTKPV